MTLEEFKHLTLEECEKYVHEKIEYGWIDTKERRHYGANSDDNEYYLQSPNETLKRSIAICWDITELLRYYFEENGYEVSTYLIYLYITEDYCPSHSILAYKKDNNLVWFEPTQTKKMERVRTYSTEKELIQDLKNRFIENGIKNHFFKKENDLSKIVCYRYEKPSSHIRGSAFYNHCRTGKKVI